MIDGKWQTENSLGYAKGRQGQGLADGILTDDT